MRKLNIILIIVVILLGNLVSCRQENAVQIDQTEPEGSDTTELQKPDDFSKIDESTDGMGGTEDICHVHDVCYHSLPSSLIEYVGEDVAYAWFEQTSIRDETSDCPYPNGTIYEFIHHFEIPQSVMEEMYLSKNYESRVWNLDLLYSDDKQAVDEYYRDIERLQKITDKRRAFGNLKFAIFVENENEWSEKFGNSRTTLQISLGEIVSALNITRSELENYAEESVDPGCESYDYNYDAIYNADGSIRGTGVTLFSTDPEPALAADAAFCGIDDYYLE